jgi:hypothetical protein
MTEPDRPGLAQLEEAICNAVAQVQEEWDITVYEAVGVLTVLAARYAHSAIEHHED